MDSALFKCPQIAVALNSVTVLIFIDYRVAKSMKYVCTVKVQ
jgi:hypothetical protein